VVGPRYVARAPVVVNPSVVVHGPTVVTPPAVVTAPVVAPGVIYHPRYWDGHRWIVR
jgi:hypothetical protein